MQDLLRYVTDEEYLYEKRKEDNSVRGTLVEVHIADIHFGVLNPEYQYKILEEQFLSKIENIYFDILSIDGDLFDHKFMSNSDPVMYAIKFIDRCVSICRNKRATLVIIDGTDSHDSQQLKLFYHYLEDPTIDIRIVEQVKFEYIKGAKILCIPEMYGKGKEYYNHFLFNSGIYDGVFMHGTLKGAVYGTDNVEDGLDSPKYPIFKMSDFDFCRGPIMSGHVHPPGCFNKHFYYCGSALRFRFGEEENKGFYIVIHNLDTTGYYIHFEEIKSYRYITMDIDNMIMQDPKDLIDFINNKKKSEGIDYFKVKVNKELNDNEIANLEILKSYFRNNTYIKLEYQNYKNRQAIQANKEALEKYKEYDFILDKNLTEYDKLAMYINKKEDCNYITGEELKQIILEDL